jgi:hypothetical protein
MACLFILIWRNKSSVTTENRVGLPNEGNLNLNCYQRSSGRKLFINRATPTGFRQPAVQKRRKCQEEVKAKKDVKAEGSFTLRLGILIHSDG